VTRDAIALVAVGVLAAHFGLIPCLAASPAASAAKPKSSPTRNEISGPSGQGAAVDARGTSKAPLVVEVKENETETTARVAETQHRKQELINSRYTMYFTGAAMLVALFQLGFFYWQLRLMRSSVRDTELAARAAELNAKAAIGIELPVLRVMLPDLATTAELIGTNEPYAGTVNDGPPEKYSAIGLFVIKNFGRTPAFPEEIGVGWSVASTLPEMPNYRHRSRLPHASVIKADEEFMADVHYGIELSDAEVEAAASGTAWLWVYGYVSYTDFLQSRREARFCWRFANRNFDNVFYHFASDGEPPKAYIQAERGLM